MKFIFIVAEIQVFHFVIGGLEFGQVGDLIRKRLLRISNGEVNYVEHVFLKVDIVTIIMVIQTNILAALYKPGGNIIDILFTLNIKENIVARSGKQGIVPRAGKKIPFVHGIPVVIVGFGTYLLDGFSYKLVIQPVVGFELFFIGQQRLYYGIVIGACKALVKGRDGGFVREHRGFGYQRLVKFEGDGLSAKVKLNGVGCSIQRADSNASQDQ